MPISQPHRPPSLSAISLCEDCGKRCFDLSPPTPSLSGRSDASACSTASSSSPHRDLLERVFATCDPNVSLKFAEAHELAHCLGLGQPGAYPGFTWDVSSHPYADSALGRLRLPEKHKHSGQFNWIGLEKQAYPQYLFDSETFATVEATPDRLRKYGYCAVSWTWGRFQKRNEDGTFKWRHSSGLSWRVPELDKIESRFFGGPKDRLTHLKHLLRSIKAFRYFWVDIFCINQDDNDRARAEKKVEIGKQAQIFQNATASLAYLWTLDEYTRHELSGAVDAFGALLSSCVHFKPGQPFLGGSTALRASMFPPHDLWKDRKELFTLLQDDKWFTSLWALQEMVLFPSAVWMTQDGGVVTINDRPVTTRLFATAVRLLRHMSRLRKEQWPVEVKRYIQEHNMAPRQFSQLRKELSDLEHQRKLALQEGSAKDRDQRDDSDLCIEMSYAPHTPSVLKHHLADQPLQVEIDKWVDWSYGKAGIDICLGATRTAILIAGSHREVVDNQSKEYALLAALKIGNHKELIPESLLEAQHRHFSHNLLNVILQHEGPTMFNVVHESFIPEFKTLSTNPLDISDWDIVDLMLPYIYVEVPKGAGNHKTQRRNSDEALAEEWTTVSQRYEPVRNEIRYHQNGHDRYVAIPQQRDLLLTDMSPWKARHPNYNSPSLDSSTRAYVEDVAQWHFHPSGKVHVPETARVQDISEHYNSTEIKIRFNGDEVVEYEISRFRDFKLICNTQKWLCEKLGRPLFLLLPLYKCLWSQKGGALPRTSIGNYHGVKNEERVGIVLVGKETLRKDQSLTTWYKLGTYSGKGPLTALGWKDGIIVTSPHEETQTSSSNVLEGCEKLMSESKRVTQNLFDAAAWTEKDYVIISSSELKDLEHTRSRGPQAPG